MSLALFLLDQKRLHQLVGPTLTLANSRSSAAIPGRLRKDDGDSFLSSSTRPLRPGS